MGAELKIIFDNLNKVKKSIEDGFKKGTQIQVDENRIGGRGKVPQSYIKGQQNLASQFKQNIDALEGLKSSMNRFKDFEKIQEINNRIMKENNKISQIQNNISKVTGGGVVSGGKGKGGKGGLSVGIAALLGGVIGLMTQLVQSSKSVQFLLQFIGGMIDALVGPFVPILVGLMKPVFTVLMFLMGFLVKFFQDPVAALQDLFTGLLDVIKNIFGFGGKDKQKDTAKGVGAIGGAVVGGALGGHLGALIGSMLGPLIVDAGIKFVHMLLNFGAFLGEKLAEGVIWVSKKLYDFTVYLGDKLADGILWIYDVLISSWNGLTNILFSVWDSLKTIFSNSWGNVTEWLATLWEDLKSAFSSAWELLSEFGDWLWTNIKNAFSNTWNNLKDIGKWFANKLVDALNDAIDMLNLVPGVNVGKISHINDGVINPAGKIVSVNPKDYLLASKNPRDLMNNNSGNNITINLTVNGNADRSMIDMIKRELRKELNTKGAF